MPEQTDTKSSGTFIPIRNPLPVHQKKTNDWEKTNKQLEKEFFTIDENIKYEMQKEGYRLEDLEKAEKLSVQTGKKAMELIRAKGKASDNRKWSDVVKKEELQAAETTEVPK